MEGWIELAKRKPPVDGPCLVYCPTADRDNPLITQAWFSPAFSSGWNLIPAYWIPHITHWMHLPLPPDAWGRCRKCKQPVFDHQKPVVVRDKDQGPTTKGCVLLMPFYFHQKCQQGLTLQQMQEMGSDTSQLFDGD